jgi:two-component system, OmpR family, sensor histidine kinase CreC
MKRWTLKGKIAAGFFVLSLASIGVVAYGVFDELRPRYLEAVEETLVDASQLLAAQIAVDYNTQSGTLDIQRLRQAVERLKQKSFSAQINRAVKRKVDLRVYVTDARGIVLFDSESGLDEGRDYSQWNDVYLTLKGLYGARSTRRDPENPDTSVLYIAAPIEVGGKIQGVVSVGKAVATVVGFIDNAKLRLMLGLVVVVVLALVLSLLVSTWISRPLNRLTRYVRSLASDSPLNYPRLSRDEVGDVGQAFEELRRELAGKAYIENYVHNLTHEIKSPLSAIIGASELVSDPEMKPSDRARLLANISSEAHRLQDIAERILELASLENRERALKIESFDLILVLEEVLESFEGQRLARSLNWTLRVPQNCVVSGERFLVWRALSNLIQNAVDFAPDSTAIDIEISRLPNGTTTVEVLDRGPGIPDWAQEKVFEKFFSLERVRTHKKSSGLGLNFVREVMQLHRGKVQLLSRDGGGLIARLEFTSNSN